MNTCFENLLVFKEGSSFCPLLTAQALNACFESSSLLLVPVPIFEGCEAL